MSAKTILTKAGLAKTYWGKKIIEAENRGNFTEKMIDNAGGWSTCACGKQESVLKIGGNSEPWDRKLEDEGFRFYCRVEKHKFEAAAKQLIKIQERSIYLLNEITKKGLVAVRGY